MKVKHLIAALKRIDPESNIGLINTNYGSWMEYDLSPIIKITKYGPYLIIHAHNQVGYFDWDCVIGDEPIPQD